METPGEFVRCVRQYVVQLFAEQGVAPIEAALAQPTEFWAQQSDRFREALKQAGFATDTVAVWARSRPYVLLRNAFDASELPETPTNWYPVPVCSATVAATALVVLLAGAFRMEAVSYRAENDGVLLVNLVALAGKGAMAEKSVGGMRGHTDAATFPFRGTLDPQNRRIAPSPDIVFLAALRNPDEVPTIVMPLPGVLARLTADQIALLKGPNLVLNAQRSFQRGTTRILGEEHLLDGAAILMDGEDGTWVRYTHSQSHVHDEADHAVVEAKAAFEAACAESVLSVVLRPGDLLLVNNRKALHGRAPVGAALGGESRWLLRSYGLDCSSVSDEQRYEGPRYMLYP